MRGILSRECLENGNAAIVIESSGIYKLRLTSLLMSLLILASSASIAEPTPYRAVYKASYNGVPISATGIRELSRTDDGGYVLRSEARAFIASVKETTHFEIKDGITPLEYQYHRKGIGKNESDVLKFDWQHMQVARVAEENAWERDMVAGTQDKLSYQLEMRDELARAWKAGTNWTDTAWPEMSYQVAEDDGRIREYRFRVEGQETVDVPAGKFDTIKATRVRDDSARETHFWLAPDYDFLLVRFEHKEEDGGGFKLLLKTAEFDGEPI